MVDIATRVWNHKWKIDPIVRSLIDTDFYKLLMCQSIFRNKPDTTVVFSLINRSTKVRLADLIKKPTVLLPIYFYCPNSCSTNLANLALAINRMKLEAGRDYQVIALSFSERETPEDARNAKNNYLKLLYDGFPEEQWRFLTGTREHVAAVLDTIGVDPAYGQRGVGHALMSQLFANLEALRIDRVETAVHPSERALLGFMLATGFVRSSRLAFSQPL